MPDSGRNDHNGGMESVDEELNHGEGDGSQVRTEDSEWSLTARSMITTAVVLGATLMVLATMQPQLIFRDNTPTGGDMGAHVWGPAFLRDVLLPGAGKT